MKINDDNLRALFQGYATSKAPPNRKRCPSPKAIAESFEPSASVRKKKKIVDHLSGCSYCREEFMLFFQIQKSDLGSARIEDRAAPYESAADLVKKRHPAHPPFWQYACVLLGFCLTIFSIFLIVQQNDLSEVQRNKETGILLSTPKAGQILAGSLVFRWQGKSATEYYVLELFDEALMPIWTSSEIRDTKLRLPADVRSGLQPGRSYFWMVTAYSGNSELVESKLARFTIRN
jgi:hypothetical protein